MTLEAQTLVVTVVCERLCFSSSGTLKKIWFEQWCTLSDIRKTDAPQNLYHCTRGMTIEKTLQLRLSRRFVWRSLSVMLNWLLRAIHDIRMALTDATRKVLLDHVQEQRRRDKHARRCQCAVDAFAIKASIMCYARRRHVIFCTRPRSRHPSF